MTYDPELQKTLDKLWFKLPSEAARREMGLDDDDLGLRQKWLVRIFQSCAPERNSARGKTLRGVREADDGTRAARDTKAARTSSRERAENDVSE